MECWGSGHALPIVHAVVLSVEGEDHLLQIEQQLQAAHDPSYKSVSEIYFRAIREPDAPWNGQLMAIGIKPTLDRSILKPILGKLRLLK